MASTKSAGPKEAGKRAGNVGDASGIRKRKMKDLEGLEFAAPDGGWGWVVVIACGMSNFSTLPVGQNFGLIYKEKFEEWGITQAEYSFMRNLEFSISSCAGLISGVLLKTYGFRRMSLIGGLLCALSVLITSQLTTITYFTIFFAVLGGMGSGIGWPANALALNTYFKKRRGVATGFSWTATGLSPVLMPLLISFLMEYTDVHGTVLILAGIALHTIPASLLLQPVHWHGKWIEQEKKDTKTEDQETNEERQAFLDAPHCEEHSKCRRASLRRGQMEGAEDNGDYIVDTQSTLGLDVTAPISRHSSHWSLGSTGCLRQHAVNHCEDRGATGDVEVPVITVTNDANEGEVGKKKKGGVEECVSSPKPMWKRVLMSVVEYFDLTIMKDPKFLIIFVGMTLAFAAEINFALFVPFVYAEFGYEKSQVALFMTISAFVDLVTRFTVPIFTDKLNLDPKLSYAFGLTILASVRIVLAHAEEFTTIMVATLFLGFGKGFRTVYMALVIPSYVPLHRLPTASGLQMLANGVVFLTIGPLFGSLRDNSDNYAASLHSINILTFTAVALWISESLVTCYRRRLSRKDAGVKIEITTANGTSK